MSIPVTCPDCQSHFHVGDEFAGRPGRCPECSAVIEVPTVDDTTDDHLDPLPYWTPRGVEAFEEFPASSRQPRHEEPARPRERREEFDDRPVRFDPNARAARWLGVSHGLRNLMVAVVLMSIDVFVIGAFFVVDGVKPGPQNNFIGRDIALTFGTGVTAAISLLLWTMGRLGCARVPYVPARAVAVPAAIVAGLTGVSGVIGFGLFAAGVLMAQQGNLNGLAVISLSTCAILPALLGFWLAELMGLWSQIRMAEGLADPPFGRSSRVLLVGSALLMALTACMVCGLVMVSAAAEQRAQKQRQAQKQQVPPAKEEPAAPVKDALPAAKNVEVPPAKGGPPNKDEPVAAPKDPGPPVVQEAPPAQAAPPPANPPANADPPQRPEVYYAMIAIGLLATLAYAGLSVFCFQAGRRAIRREIVRLIGNPHDEHH